MRVMQRQNAKSLDNVVARQEKDDGTSSDEGKSTYIFCRPVK